MAKIKLSEPEGPYSCCIDTKVMEIKIEEAFLGVGFTSPDGEKMVVTMRDGGFEIRYAGSDRISRWLDLKDGHVNLKEAMLDD